MSLTVGPMPPHLESSQNPNRFLKNLPKVFFFNFSFMFMTIISVIVPIWQSFGLTLQEVYELQAIFGGVMLVLDVPTGYLSDLFGRKSSLIVVGILNGLAFLVFSLSHTFWGFACFEVLGATAMSLYSGCDIALLYDSLEASGVQSNTQTNLLGKRLFYSQIGETVASLLGGALVVYSLRWPVRVNAVLAWIPLLIALTVDEPPRKMLQTKKHFENFRFIFRSVFGHSRLLSFLFFFTIFYGFCSFAALWSLQGYWKNLGVSVPFFGVLWAGLNLIAAVSGRYAFQAERKLGPARIVLAIGILPIIGYLGMALFQNYWGIFLGAAFYLMRGLNSVVIQDALNARVPNEIRATVNSMTSLGMRGIFILLGPLMGYFLDHQGYRSTFIAVSGIIALAFFFLCVPLLRMKAEFRAQT